MLKKTETFANQFGFLRKKIEMFWSFLACFEKLEVYASRSKKQIVLIQNSKALKYYLEIFLCELI